MLAHDSTLYPPNYSSFDDRVVSRVLQRFKPSYLDGGITEDSAKEAESSFATIQNRQSSMQLALPSSTETIPHSSHTFLRKRSTTPKGDTKPSRLDSRDHTDSPTTHRRGTRSTRPLTSDQTEKLRERNRMHQMRYKMRQRERVKALETSVLRLRDEVQQLEVQRQVLSANTSTSTTAWSVATEYFRLFRHGVKEFGAVVGATNAAVPWCPYEVSVQQKFLRQVMMPNVACGATRGVEAMLEGWQLVSLCNGDVNIQLARLEIGADDALIATTHATHTFNENTLRYAFPHLIRNGEEDKWSPLATKLVGQQLLVRGSVHFTWNAEKKRVASVEYKADLLTPLVHLLGNLEDVSHVFDNALLTPECGLVAE